MPPLPPGYAEIVKRFQAKTLGILFPIGAAAENLCTEERRRIRRHLVLADASTVAGLADRKSWLLAIVISGSSDVSALTQWRASLPHESADRVIVYFLKDVDASRSVAAWKEAGVPSPLAFPVMDFASFHRAFGKHLNNRIWRDSGDAPKPGPGPS